MEILDRINANIRKHESEIARLKTARDVFQEYQSGNSEGVTPLPSSSPSPRPKAHKKAPVKRHAPKTPAKKAASKMTPQARKQIAEAMKKRWADLRARQSSKMAPQLVNGAAAGATL